MSYFKASVFDLCPYMWLYTVTLCLWVSRAVEFGFGSDSPLMNLVVLPFAIMGLDVVENSCALFMTVTYPEKVCARVSQALHTATTQHHSTPHPSTLSPA